MSIHNFANAIITGSSGQGGGVVEQSLKFNDDDLSFLTRVFATDGNRKTWTWSGWIKRGNIGTAQRLWGTINGSSQEENIRFEANNTIRWYCHNAAGSAADNDLSTVAVFRDVASWYHIQIVKDTTESTAANRNKLYVNGVLQSWAGTNYASLNYDGWINASGSDNYHRIGAHAYSTGSSPFDGYMSDIHFIDGQALTPTSFGETVGGYWKKKDYTGSYGTNGFKLNFRDDTVSEGFNAVTYSGNGTSQSVSGLGLSPDLVWVKERTNTSNHVLTDTVRGAGPILSSNTTTAENAGVGQYLQSFDSDGFTIGNSGAFNAATDTYVAWCWDAGSGSPVSNTDGSITSTVKANNDYGFSIASFTGASTQGATFGHGLDTAPSMVIAKARTAGQNWFVYHSALGYTKSVFLNLTNASATDNNTWRANPTSSLVTIGDNFTSSNNYIAYCFAEKTGYSKFSSYTGTGATGNSITGLGFAPAFVMIKRSDAGSEWAMYDNTRQTSNPKYQIRANANDAENSNSAVYVDLDSDGFTIQTTDAAQNASGGTYIYMAVADTREAAFWKDVSGENSNNWTPNNLDYRDSLIDSPANNFATFNALNLPASAVLSEGNLKFTQTVNDRAAAGNMSISSGKWYFEVRYTAGTNPETGLAPINQSYANSGATSSTDKLLLITNSTGMRTPSWSTTDTTGISAQTSTTILGFAVDADNGKMFISVNGTYFNSGDPAAGTNPQATFDSDWLEQTGGGVVPFSGIYTGTSGEVIINFGQDSTFSGARAAGAYTDSKNIGSFAYQPPSGYLALCTANLPTPVIIDGSEYFNTVLYTGTGATQSITGVGFGSAPDFVWIKDRTTAYDHHLFDVVRGGGNSLYSNDTVIENTYATDITFDADGFTIADGSTTPQIYINKNTDAFASWNWKAGGTAVSNTDGTITSQVSANVDAGISIVSYTGNGSTNQTVGHGLGVKPSMVFYKDRDSTSAWRVIPTFINDGHYLELHATSAILTTSTSYFGTNTSSVLGISGSNSGIINASGNDIIAYCFADVDGYSKAGSYVGNSSADGSFVYTGFRPAWILIKSTSSATDWMIYDNKRLGYNVDNNPQRNVAAAEQTDNDIDLLSNGFKFRRSSPNFNGATHIYLAFAEVPFKVANAR